MKLASLLFIIGLGLLMWGGIAFSQEIGDSPELLGGQTTIFNDTDSAFEQPIPHLDPLNHELFLAGGSFFNLYWITTPVSTTQTDGLAPLFNARACASCHFRNGRGSPPQNGAEAPTGLLLRLSIPDPNEQGKTLPDPTYGEQLQDQAPQGEGLIKIIYTEIQGTFADGTPYTLRAPTYQIEHLAYGELHPQVMLSPRLGTQLIGLGLLEAVPEKDLVALADPDDLNGDGISGRINYVWDEINQVQAVGRFGWKATQPNLVQQVGVALSQDMGITTPFFPQENCTAAQPICPHSATTEMTVKGLLEVVTYVSALGVPAQREAENPTVLMGQALFREIGCVKCHVDTLETGTHTSIVALSSQTFHPYTDLLLHDMGEGLADHRPDEGANGSEWRTPPLWGIGLFETVGGAAFYLHDGRAQTLEEAILWHGGEAQTSRDAFLNLSQADREALLAFLRSL